ncbi:Uncharacterised protein [Escherichia coli]|nr:Uncharacterised protein [Escherichia coli]
MLTVFGLLNSDAPHGIPFIVRVLPLFRELLQLTGVILRQFSVFQQLFTEMCFINQPFVKIQVTFRIIAGPADGLHECRFTHQVDAADIKIIIIPRPDITGGTPVQRRTKITGGGFNMTNIRNLLFREPELKLHRRVINGQFRDRRYLKISRYQFNGYRRCRGINPERGTGRLPLLTITVYRPDRQGVFPRRQATETVLRVCSDGSGHQTAVFSASAGQAKTEAHALHHPWRVPFRLRQILAVRGTHRHREVLHGRRCDTVQRTGQRLKGGPVIHNGFLLRYMLHRRDGKGAVRVFPDGHTAEQATAKTGYFQSPHTVCLHAIRQGTDLYPVRLGVCGDVHTHRLTAAVNQVHRGGAGFRKRHLTVQRQDTTGYIGVQNTSAGHGPGIVIITDFYDVTRRVTQPL